MLFKDQILKLYLKIYNFYRYEQWTTPEYYRTAYSNFQSNSDKQNKSIVLEKRREKLKIMFNAEKEQYAKEIEGIQYTYTNTS